jgi:peptide/nickel transport system substrate-binding protein
MEERQNKHLIEPGASISRRQFLKGAAVVGGGAVLSAIAAACGATPTAAPASTPAGSAATQAPAATAAAAVPKHGGILTWGMEVPPVNMIPFGGISQGQVLSKEMLYDSLVEWDKDLKVQPALAESWETPDDKTWIWHLRKGAKFHDGSEVTADDVKYSIELQANPPPPGVKVGQYPKIASVDVVDKYTAKFNMTGPDPTVLGYLAWARYSPIIPKGLYDKINVLTNGIGTGPFKLTEFVENDRIVNVRNTDFWKPGQPYYDGLTFKVLPDESSRVAALRSGAIDGCVVGPDTARTLKGDPNIIVYKGPVSAPRVLQFTIKGDGKPWNNKAVRQAISKGIDRQQIIDKVYAGEAVYTGPVPPGYGDWFIPSAELASGVEKYDPDGAKKLLSDAGFKDGFPITLYTISAPNDYTLIGEVVKENLAKIGITVTVTPEELGSIAKRVGDGSFDFLCTGRGMRPDVTGHIVDFGRPGAGGAKPWFGDGKGWSNDEASKLFELALVNLDSKTRHEQTRRIQDIVLDEVPHVYLVQPFAFNAVRSYVKDHYVSFTNFNVSLRTVWLDK